MTESDLEIVRACYDAMGDLPAIVLHNKEWRFGYKGCYGPVYDPLTDDAACFALVRKLGLSIEHFHPIAEAEWTVTGDPGYPMVHDDDLRRAVCLCVASIRPNAVAAK